MTKLNFNEMTADGINHQLMSLLNEAIGAEVVALDNAFRKLRSPQEKHEFIDRQFSENGYQFERWMRYCWLRMELTYLGNQKELHNAIKGERQRWKQNESGTPLPYSIASTIAQAKEQGAPFEDVLHHIAALRLCVVNTEHPTDPMSQHARDILADIAKQVEYGEDAEYGLMDNVRALLNVDSIPHSKRTIEEEVNRGIKVIQPLFESLPKTVKEVHRALKRYYPEAYKDNIELVWKSLEGNGNHHAFIEDASWPGFDADGNTNATPEELLNAIRIHRLRAVERYKIRIDEVIEGHEKIKTDAQETLIGFIFDYAYSVSNDKRKEVRSNFKAWMTHHQDSQKNIENYEAMKNYLQTGGVKESFVSEMIQCCDQLIALQKFRGDFEKLKKELDTYRTNILSDSNRIYIGEHYAVNYFIQKYATLVAENKSLLDQHEKLAWDVRLLGVQLRSYGLTLGKGHIRQDSGEFKNTWNAIIGDLITHKELGHNRLLEPFRVRAYNHVEAKLRSHFHQQLLSGSDEANQLLDQIYKLYNTGQYLNGDKYKNHPDFKVVRRELHRMEIAVMHHDMVDNLIISNTSNVSSIGEVESLREIFIHGGHLQEKRDHMPRVVPLLEEREILAEYETLLSDAIRARIARELVRFKDHEAVKPVIETLQLNQDAAIQTHFLTLSRDGYKELLALHSDLKAFLAARIEMEVMLGYSDPERVSGIAELPHIKETEENISQLIADFGVSERRFKGPGSDANRGGEGMVSGKMTKQGDGRSRRLGTPRSAKYFRSEQFALTFVEKTSQRNTEITLLDKETKALIEQLSQIGTQRYEFVHNAKGGLGKILGYLFAQTNWLVTLGNSSSRATQRGIREGSGDRTASVQTNGDSPIAYVDPAKPRAITATQLKDIMRDNMHLILGSVLSFIELEAQREGSVKKVYDASSAVRDMYHKTLLGLARSDMEFLSYSMFHAYPAILSHLTDPVERARYAEEARTLVDTHFTKGGLKDLRMEDLMKDRDGQLAATEMLAKLVALLWVERDRGLEQLFELNKQLFPQKQPPERWGRPSDILYPFEKLQKQEKTLAKQLDPVSYAVSHVIADVREGKKLDQTIPGLNGSHKEHQQHSELSGVASMLGDLVCAAAAGRALPPSFYSPLLLDWQKSEVNR
ncbi:MAG: phosphoenolpyruvate carboxylase [Alphaproteobacteria bacterium]|nr:phosphoenolpyruvate carboxylase [Alphaproteobacteria bacterium]